MTATRRTRFAALFSIAALATGLTLVAPAVAHQGGHGGHAAHHGNDLVRLPLPNGFRPEGIATGSRYTAYLGSLADGDILALDLRSGQSRTISQGPGTPSVGLDLDHTWLFVSGGSGGDARVVDVRSGELLASYPLVPAGTPSFINDNIVTDDAAWFTDSMDNALYRLPLDDRHRGQHGRHGDDRRGHAHHHGHHSLPDQDEVEQVDLTGDWVQNAGFNANGITTSPGGRALLVVNSSDGQLYRVAKDGDATLVDLGGFTITNGDGLLREGRTLYAVQNRLNQVAVIKLDKHGRTGELVDTLTTPACGTPPSSTPCFDVPTTIARSGRHLYLPNARFTTPPTPDTEYWVTGIDD
jgi:sugar lactone lactonase YvrE